VSSSGGLWKGGERNDLGGKRGRTMSPRRQTVSQKNWRLTSSPTKSPT